MANDYLNRINNKETNAQLVSLRSFAEENKVPIITYDGINFINQIIKIKQVKRVLEIGTAIGYSSIKMALANNVEITTIERNPDMYKIAKKNIKEANLNDKINIIFDDALLVDEDSLGEFDLIFIDAAKAQSINFFNKYQKLLVKNGIIITDNLLFHELVYAEIRDRNLRQLVGKIDRFNKFIVAQENYDTYIYELGDGMSLSIKKD